VTLIDEGTFLGEVVLQREGGKTSLWLVSTAVCEYTRTSMGKEYNQVLQIILDASRLPLFSFQSSLFSFNMKAITLYNINHFFL